MTDLATGISGWKGASAGGAMAACAALFGAGSAVAETVPLHPVDQFCTAMVAGDATRRECVRAQHTAADLIVAYATPLGYFTPEGELVRSKIIRDSLGMRAVFGLSPEDSFARCLDVEPTVAGVGVFGTFDMVSVWNCVKKHDPEAARLENL